MVKDAKLQTCMHVKKQIWLLAQVSLLWVVWSVWMVWVPTLGVFLGLHQERFRVPQVVKVHHRLKSPRATSKAAQEASLS